MPINLTTPNLFELYSAALSRAFYDLGFEDFCRVAELNPSYRNSFDQFKQFQACIRAMNLVDGSTWENLLKAHLPAPADKALSDEQNISNTL